MHVGAEYHARWLIQIRCMSLSDRAWSVGSSRIRGGYRKKRAKCRGVSAAAEHSPFTIAPMRVAGTRKAIASAFTDIPSGERFVAQHFEPAGWRCPQIVKIACGKKRVELSPRAFLIPLKRLTKVPSTR
jgi:hypothetical protein